MARMLLVVIAAVLLSYAAATTTGGTHQSGSGSGTDSARSPNEMQQCLETIMQSQKPNCGAMLGLYLLMGGDPQATMTCVTGMRNTLPPTCQAIVDRLNTNSMGVNLLTCSQNAMHMCVDSEQMMSVLSGLKGGGELSLDPAFYTDLFKCFNSKTSELSTGCQALVQQNLATASSHSALKPDDCDAGEEGCDKQLKGTGQTSAAFAVLFSLCALGFCGSSIAAVYFYRKAQQAPPIPFNDVELAAVEERVSLSTAAEAPEYQDRD